MSYPQRVASRAAEIKPAKAALTIVATPFYVIGLVLGLILVAALWCWAAVGEGIDTARGESGEMTDGAG